MQRCTRSVHERLKLTFDILTGLYLKTTEQFRLLYALPDYIRELYSFSVTRWTGSTTNRITVCRFRPTT